MSLLELPDSAITKIAGYLPLNDVINLCLTCKRVYSILDQDQHLWNSLALNDWLKVQGDSLLFSHTKADLRLNLLSSLKRGLTRFNISSTDAIASAKLECGVEVESSPRRS